jgi:hypothetical protein
MNQQFPGSGRRRYLLVRNHKLPKILAIPVKGQRLDEFLRLNPHIAAESRDDAKCKTFLGELGVLECLARSNEPNLSVLTFPNHPTHWIVGLRWSGYPKPEQNGYRIFCLPKQQATEADAKKFVQYIMDTYGGYAQEDSLIQLPADWRKGN